MCQYVCPQRGHSSFWSQVLSQPLVPCPFCGGGRGLPHSPHWSCHRSCPGGTPVRSGGYPPPVRTGVTPEAGEQMMLRRGRYASCSHTGGLSCCLLMALRIKNSEHVYVYCPTVIRCTTSVLHKIVIVLHHLIVSNYLFSFQVSLFDTVLMEKDMDDG